MTRLSSWKTLPAGYRDCLTRKLRSLRSTGGSLISSSLIHTKERLKWIQNDL